MITSVEIENYQAVKKAVIRLGKFTVVTGPTGSGKSAVIRAMQLVAFNERGTRFIRHGTKSAKAALGFRDENIAVGIERGGRGKDAYRVAWHEGGFHEFGDDTNGAVFTKLGGEVPPEVREILKLGEINFAGQWDKPYLLSEAGGQVARVLGELTNVTLVLDAAREANRRKLELTRRLRSYEDILRSLTETAQKYLTLAVRRGAAAQARLHLESAERISDRISKLNGITARLDKADAALSVVDMWLDETAPPDLEKLDQLQERARRLRTLYAQHREAEQAGQRWEKAAAVAAQDEGQAHWDLHKALVAAGTCPTCGQEVGARRE